MRICLATSTFLPTIGGAEIAIHHLSNALTQMGEEVVIFAPKNKSLRNFNLGYKIESYPMMYRGKKYIQGYIFATYLIIIQKRYKFDIIHVHKAKMGYYATKIKKLLKVPIIITTHGGDIQKYYEINYGDRLDPFWNKRIEYAIKNADLLTAIGSSTRRDYLDIGVKEGMIIDNPNGVDLNRFNASCKDIRDILGLSKDIKILLAVGRYHIKKGYEYLIKAMPNIISQYKNVKCLIIGNGLDILRKMINDLNVKEHIILLDQQSFNHSENSSIIDLNKLPNDILLSAYKSSDIYVSSSLIEGFALTLVEAMAAGLPLVATNVPGNEDAVIDGGNGFLVPAKDPKSLAEKIITLLNNDSLKAELGARSRYLAKKYDWKLIASQYLTQYKRLIR